MSRLSSDWVLGAAAAAATALAGVYVGRHAAHDPVDRAFLEAVIVGVPMAVGAYLARSPRDRRFGLMLFGAGLIWSLTALAESDGSLAYSTGRVVAWLIFPLLVYLMLAFPEGRLSAGLSRALFASVTAVIAALYIGSALFVETYPRHTPWAGCAADCPANAFMVTGSEPAFVGDVLVPVREGLGVLLLAAVGLFLAARMRAASPLERRARAPVVLMCFVWLATLVAFLLVRGADPDARLVGTLARVWSLCIPAIALAFLYGVVQRRALLGDVLRRLGGALTLPLDPDERRAALATALDAPALRDDDELLEGVSALVRASVEHERMAVRLAASRAQLADSRERIARAADEERSRIERDLHDGAQQRLVMLRIKLSLAEDLLESDPVAGTRAVRALGEDVDLALEELRALAHGVYPSLLSDRGLEDALRGLLLESPLPAHLEVRGVTRQPVEIETAVYFVCLEALQNANKHARGATGLWIFAEQGDALRVEIRDDGTGFAPGAEANGGLRNMRDRVEAVGGELTIDAAPGRGTRIAFGVPVVTRRR